MGAWVLSQHAREEIARRGIPHALLNQILARPQQLIPAQGIKKVYQSQLDYGGERIFLLRAIVDDTIDPAVVITVYPPAKSASIGGHHESDLRRGS